jgi:tRNA-2-methylthio-N6-dimethylallyladenosine synthase
MKSAKREISITSDIIVGFPGETENDFSETLSLLAHVGFDSIFGFKYSPRPNTPSLSMPDSIPVEEKARRLTFLQEYQREIQNTIMNFTASGDAAPAIGSYVPVRTTASFPNSLAGEMVI